MIRRAGELRYRVTVKRPPPGNFGTRGQKEGGDITVYANWPCSIETLSGSEAELARQNFPTASLTVSGYTDPKNPIKPSDYLLLGTRRLNVAFVNDVDQLGLQADLICGESVS